jgi:hypothetical protein
MNRTENDALKNPSIVAVVFVVAETFFTEPLRSNVKGIHIQTDGRDL